MDEALTPENEEPAPFQMTDSQTDDAITVAVEGDLDLCTAPTLREYLNGVLPRMEGRPLLVLDFRGVAFIDSAGLALLVETRRRLGDGAELGLIVARSSQPERVLQLGRFETFLKIGLSEKDVLGP